MQQAILHIALVVRDYDEAIDFYCNKLHFRLVEDTYQPEQDKRWVLVAPSDAYPAGCIDHSCLTYYVVSGIVPGMRVFLGEALDRVHRLVATRGFGGVPMDRQMAIKEEIPCRGGILIWIAVLLFFGYGLSAQQAPTPRPADVSKSSFEIFMTNLPGILTGLAGILAAGVGWHNSQKKIEDSQKKIEDSQKSIEDLRLKLIDKRNLELIAINGEFLTKTRKDDFESFLRGVLCNETFTGSIPLAGRVKQAEVILQAHEEKIFDLESTVDPAELQRRRMARVMPLLGVLQQEGRK